MKPDILDQCCWSCTTQCHVILYMKHNDCKGITKQPVESYDKFSFQYMTHRSSLTVRFAGLVSMATSGYRSSIFCLLKRVATVCTTIAAIVCWVTGWSGKARRAARVSPCMLAISIRAITCSCKIIKVCSQWSPCLHVSTSVFHAQCTLPLLKVLCN